MQIRRLSYFSGSIRSQIDHSNSTDNQRTNRKTELMLTQYLSAEQSMKESEWTDQAKCAGLSDSLTDVFFSEELQDIATAKRICAECPVMAECLEGAIQRREPSGVWGGQLFMNGKVLMIKRRRGRPPKVARPEDQVPVIPVPAHLEPMLRTA